MSSYLHVMAQHAGGMKVTVHAGDHVVPVDYPTPGRPAESPTPLELLLASLASCVANGLAAVLSRDGHPPRRLEVEASGTRRDTHPTVLESIRLVVHLSGEGIDGETGRVALAAAERICPVWAMLRAGTPIHTAVDVTP